MQQADIEFIPDEDQNSISSDVAIFGDLLISTQIPLNSDGEMEEGDIQAQSECTLFALKKSLEKAGSSLDRVLHLTIYLTHPGDRLGFNEVYRRYFSKPWPVRACIGVAALGKPGMRVEVTAIAAKIRSQS
ncbi:RidA family protein [Pseudomonas sp. PDM26]|uniref:RidA family protein n=1 Tax=Pseudomonas sp. PDM26 TaxID=2854766 RepID=UPI001C490D86|nr:RidA family protein [Pseudomonas sp. PDM26]MBV7547372.1 RidA family protein [Pseudomonas sp. PDM26]